AIFLSFHLTRVPLLSLHAIRQAIHSAQRLLRAVPAALAASSRLPCVLLRSPAGIPLARPDLLACDKRHSTPSCVSATVRVHLHLCSRNCPDAASSPVAKISARARSFQSRASAAIQTMQSSPSLPLAAAFHNCRK